MLKRLLLSLIFLGGGIVSAFAASSYPPPPASISSLTVAPVTIVATDTSPGITIPADFAGLSFEVCGTVIPCTGWNPAGDIYLTGANTPLINAIKLISSTTKIRIGGNSSDISPAPALTSTIANGIGAFATASGSTIIYGLDAKGDTQSTAVAQAQLIATGVGVGNVTFQIGNEPSLITNLSGQTNFTSNLSTYTPLWLNDYNAIIAQIPTAKFMGPDDVSTSNLPIFIAAVGAGKITDLSYHDYPLKAGNSGWTTINNMLQSTYEYGNFNSFPPASLTTNTVTVASASGLGMRMTETNAAYSGGLHGVTDALAAGAWSIDFGMTLASLGWKSIHLHGRLQASSLYPVYYTPLIQNSAGGAISASPLFYGLMIMGRMAGGQLLPVTITNGGPQGQVNVSAYAVKSTNTDGKTRIVAINRSLDRSASIIFNRSTTWTTGSALIMTGASCSDTTTVTLGGAPLAADGSWAGATISFIPGGSVTLPPCSSVLGVLN